MGTGLTNAEGSRALGAKEGNSKKEPPHTPGGSNTPGRRGVMFGVLTTLLAARLDR
jgi:hypothetical protein